MRKILFTLILITVSIVGYPQKHSVIDEIDRFVKDNNLSDPTTNLPVQQTDKTLPFESVSDKIGPKSQETPMPVMTDRELETYQEKVNSVSDYYANNVQNSSQENSNLSVSEKNNFSNESQTHYRYTEEEVKQYKDAGISLGSDPEAAKEIIRKREEEKISLLLFIILSVLAFCFFIYYFTRGSNNSDKEGLKPNKIDDNNEKILRKHLESKKEFKKIVDTGNKVGITDYLNSNQDFADSIAKSIADSYDEDKNHPAEKYRKLALDKIWDNNPNYQDAIQIINNGLRLNDLITEPFLLALRSECQTKLLHYKDALLDIEKAIEKILQTQPTEYFFITEFYKSSSILKQELGDIQGSVKDKLIAEIYVKKYNEDLNDEN